MNATKAAVLFLALNLVSCGIFPENQTQPALKVAEIPVGVEQVMMFTGRPKPRSDEKEFIWDSLNSWLKENHGRIEIIRTLQSGDAHRINITIFYKRTS